MKRLDEYTSEMAAEVERAREAGGEGAWVYYGMVLVGVVATGTLTYSLTRRGMAGAALWSEWAAFAAALPVALLEGSAVALMYGRHHWFRSRAQRELGHAASWAIWGVLVANSIAHFQVGFGAGEAMPGWLRAHTRVVLPLAIVAVPILWKMLYDRRPESQARLAALEADAVFREGLLKVRREQDALMIDAYRAAIRAPEVTAAKERLLRRAAIRQAEEVSGFIEAAEEDSLPAMRERRASHVNGYDRGN